MSKKVKEQYAHSSRPLVGADIAETKEFLATILDDLQDEVYLFAVDDLRMRYMNRSALARMGWAVEDIPNKTIADTAATFDVGMFRHHVSPLFDGRAEVVTIEVTHPKGPVEISTRRIPGPDGRCNFLSVLRDLSWRKEIEREKLRSVSTISHELRTPLTSIQGGLKLLISGVLGDLNAEQARVLDIADRNAARLLLMVNDILDFEKINANEMSFSISEVDLLRGVDEAVNLLTMYGAEHKVSLEMQSDVDHAIIWGNTDRFMQVMTNLISNAVKYSPEGGTVTVSIQDMGDSLRVAVNDKGPGIPPEEQRRLFKPFTQVKAGDGKQRAGTGLGLAIVAAILQRLEYPLLLKSAVGKGSTFGFTVPKHRIVEFTRGSSAQASVA